MNDVNELIGDLANGRSRFLCATLTREQLDDIRVTLARSSDVEVRMLRGSSCRTKIDLLGEMSAALQFPLYFRKNWDALADCFSDMSWINHSKLVLMVVDAEELLVEDVDQINLFLDVLRPHVVEDRPPGGFQIRLLMSGSGNAFQERCDQANAVLRFTQGP